MSLPRRSALRLLSSACAVGGGLLAYATLVEPRWIATTRWTVRVPGLPAAWEGMRVVHLSDFQVGMWGQSGRVARRAVTIAHSLRPDVLVLTGDIVQTGRWQRGAELFGAIARAVPTYAVLGNHDHLATEADSAAIAGALRAQGVTVLMNQHVAHHWRGESWVVVGIDDYATGHADLLRAVTGIPRDTKLLALLTHVPDAAAHVPHGWFPLMLAGHTHGAQVRLSPFRRASWLELMHGPTYSAYPRGWFEVAGGLLYVNRGIGMSSLPLRFAARPEVTLHVLTDGRALPPDVRWQARPGSASNVLRSAPRSRDRGSGTVRSRVRPNVEH